MIHATYKVQQNNAVIMITTSQGRETYNLKLNNLLSAEKQVKNYIEEELNLEITTLKQTR